MKSCDDGYPSCRQAEATGKFCTGKCAATQDNERKSDMTNTQSPAPGVAAEAKLTELMHLVDTHAEHRWNSGFSRGMDGWLDEFHKRDAAQSRLAIKEALRTALQASAAAVPVATVLEADALAEMHVALPPGTKLYTAPPLPAKVQEADLWKIAMDAFTETQDKTESIKDAWQRVVDRVLASSRTPAPGMAGGVVEAVEFCISSAEKFGGDKKTLDDLSAQLLPLLKARLAAPHPSPAPLAAGADMVSVGYQYLYANPFGGDVWRDDSRELNGNPPKASREIFTRASTSNPKEVQS